MPFESSLLLQVTPYNFHEMHYRRHIGHKSSIFLIWSTANSPYLKILTLIKCRRAGIVLFQRLTFLSFSSESGGKGRDCTQSIIWWSNVNSAKQTFFISNFVHPVFTPDVIKQIFRHKTICLPSSLQSLLWKCRAIKRPHPLFKLLKEKDCPPNYRIQNKKAVKMTLYSSRVGPTTSRVVKRAIDLFENKVFIK